MGAAVKRASSENGQLDPEVDAAAAAAAAAASAVPCSAALPPLSATPLFLGTASPPLSSPSEEELEHDPKRRAPPCPAPPPALGCLAGWALAWVDDIALLFQPAAS